MTKLEVTGKRDLTFSSWIRSSLPDSSTGFLVTDLDFIVFNYKTRKILLLEVKTRSANIKFWQKSIFELLDRWLVAGIDKEWHYYGFHTLIFENTSFKDGRCYLDGEEITESFLISFLSLESY